MKIYLATRMTGRTGIEIWQEYVLAKAAYQALGIKVLSPVEGEDIPYTDNKLADRTDAEMERIWKEKDKAYIRQSHACVYPGLSQGIMREYMLSRGVYWKPSVFIGNGGFISREEDDYVAQSHRDAARVLVERWGTWPKRVMWRLKMLTRCLPKWVWHQICEFK